MTGFSILDSRVAQIQSPVCRENSAVAGFPIRIPYPLDDRALVLFVWARDLGASAELTTWAGNWCRLGQGPILASR